MALSNPWPGQEFFVANGRLKASLTSSNDLPGMSIYSSNSVLLG